LHVFKQNVKRRTRKGFTLIELLVVIAIVAILSIVVLLTLNPAELLRQARDSNRISDLSTMKSAISLYLADVSSASSTGDRNICYVDVSGAYGTTTTAGGCSAAFLASGTMTVTASTTMANARKVNGSGWIPINLTLISSGAPIGQLGTDPLDNTGVNFYLYRPSSTYLTFKFATKMESSKYGTAGMPGDVVTTDGGVSALYYEQGTDLSL